LLRLENPPGKNHCFFNATVQLLRLLPEARFFFHQVYLYLPAARDRLGWTHDLGALFAEEGTGRVGSVDPMRKAAYFPHGFLRGQHDATELLDLIIGLENTRVDDAQTLATQLFSFEHAIERLCLFCKQVS
jgi:hypothetical protein